MRNLTLLFLVCLIFLSGYYCIPVSPPSTEKLQKPVVEKLELAITKNSSNKYCEAAYITWSVPQETANKVKHYTILRKLPEDSTFTVFFMSQQIPSEVFEFYNILEADKFPNNGFNSICYRVFAIDNYGSSGDTSDVCTLKVAPQPNFKSIDRSIGQYSWQSWVNSAVISYSLLWKDSLSSSWKSNKQTFYPSTDQASDFSVTVPDSLLPFVKGTWNYALFTESGETKSLKVGSFDVP